MSRRPPPPSRRAGNPLAVLAAIVLVPAAALVGVWRLTADAGDGGDGDEAVTLPPTTAPGATPPAAPPPLQTPLLSMRRVPGLIARALNGDAFAQQVSAFATTLDGTSCLTVEVDGIEVGAHNPDRPVIPASNQKLLTAAAALHVLGPDHVFTTEVRAGSVNGGVVDGDLYLVGGGDPLLTSPEWDGTIIGYPVPDDATRLDALAEQIAAAGIVQINGSVVGDGSRYDDETYYEEWGSDIRVAEAGPLSALLVNDSRTMVGGEWTVSESPPRGAAAELTRLLQARGVTVAGDPTTGTAPAEATVVTSIDSAPLSAVVAEMLSTSDNNTAELLVKELGVAAAGEGSRTAGTAAMAAALEELGIDTSPFVIADGSGLSPENRVTCRSIIQVLRMHSPTDAFGAALPVAAESGTLADNFVDTAMAGVMRAKTGSLSNPPYNDDIPSSKSLSGYVPTDSGTIQFSLILNSPTVNYAEIINNEPIWLALGEMLASYAPAASAPLGPVGA